MDNKKKKIMLRPKKNLLQKPVATKIFTDREDLIQTFKEMIAEKEKRFKFTVFDIAFAYYWIKVYPPSLTK